MGGKSLSLQKLQIAHQNSDIAIIKTVDFLSENIHVVTEHLLSGKFNALVVQHKSEPTISSFSLVCFEFGDANQWPGIPKNFQSGARGRNDIRLNADVTSG